MKVEDRQKLLIILTLSLLALLLGNMLLIKPLSNLWTARAQDIKKLRDDVTQGNFLLSRETAIRSQWEDMFTNTLSANKSLAEQQVIKAVDNWSQQSGATVTGLTPQWKNDSTNYMTFNCRVEAAGSLGALSRFVYYIEKGPLALKLDAVEFSAHDTTGQQLTLGLELNGLALTTLKK
jgi:hypothetical protein